MDKDLNSVQNAKPVVSVVMAVYNGAQFLSEAIQSILVQTFTDFEFIIINDGSTDNSLDILNSFKDPRIRIISNERNSGLVYSLNLGLTEAKAELIARFDADDISLPSRLEKQVAYMFKHPEMAICSSRIQLMDMYGNPNGFWAEDLLADTPDKIRKVMPNTNCIAHPAVMMRASIIKRFLYKEDFRLSEDWGLWLELLASGHRIGKINEPLVYYRVHQTSFTQTANRSGAHVKMLRFQKCFLLSRFKRRKFSLIDFKVALAFLQGLFLFPFKAYVKPFLSRVKLAINRKPWLFFSVYRKIPELIKDAKVVFFFPYYHTGGAENVHLSIVNSVNDSNPLVLFTGKSNDDAYLYNFNAISRCCDVSNYTHFPFLSAILLKRIAVCINKEKHVSVFGSNSDFLYRILPLLNPVVNKADLIHAFVKENETGPEKWSLPVVHLLNHRVFVSNHALRQMKEFYVRNNIPANEAKKLIFIRNFTTVPTKEPTKPVPVPLEILYIGRSGKEKRIPLILEVVRHYQNDNRVHFTMIGDVESLVPSDLKKSLTLPGMLHAKAMEKHLKAAHVLVLTSSREGMPMVIFEAMAHGIVPVSTAVGDVPEYVHDNITGYLLPVHPDYDVVQSLISRIDFLKSNPETLQKISHNVYYLATEQFSKEKFVDNYRKLLIQTDKK
jgi:glycosyltransferase involved in cell wall biosynthesis